MLIYTQEIGQWFCLASVGVYCENISCKAIKVSRANYSTTDIKISREDLKKKGDPGWVKEKNTVFKL